MPRRHWHLQYLVALVRRCNTVIAADWLLPPTACPTALVSYPLTGARHRRSPSSLLWSASALSSLPFSVPSKKSSTSRSAAAPGGSRPAATSPSRRASSLPTAGVRRNASTTARSICAHSQTARCRRRRAASWPSAVIRCRNPCSVCHSSGRPSPERAEQRSTGTRQPARRGRTNLSADRYSAWMRRAAGTRSPSLLLMAITSASSTMPRFNPCKMAKTLDSHWEVRTRDSKFLIWIDKVGDANVFTTAETLQRKWHYFIFKQ